MPPTLVRGIHVLALGLWFGGTAFFNSVAAPAIFESFEQVVNTSPSDRTANETIIPPDAGLERRKDLARALAGSAVGPIFPRLFVLQAVCGVAALLTALAWWKAGKVHRWRVCVIGAALVTVAVGWPLSEHVSALRVQRFDPNTETARAAKDAFGPWHLASLLLSFVTMLLAGVALALAARMPEEKSEAPPG